QLKQLRRICKVHRLDQRRMKFAQPPHDTPPTHDPRGTARMQARKPRPRSRCLENKRLAPASARQKRLQVTLDVKKVDRRPEIRGNAPLLGEARAQGNTRERVHLSRALPVRYEARAMLEQADPVLLAALILERAAQQSRPQRNSH